ncbi:cation/multidrug efflux pump [Marinimicrobium sp. ARAG 43.8]|uniref:cation/multidrug efflux pump n=1 Tax=Marinimicrobium sp. ARAG 43.8 TaxID=3418719 RepID=UPI003CEC72A1
MFYTVLSVLIVFLGLAFAYMALRLLARRHWLLGFVRGLLGLGLLVVALMLALASMDLFSYRQLTQEQAVATLSFKRLAEQRYEATLVHSNGEEETFELQGDQWQLDARLIKWKGMVAGLGVHPGYRLDRLSGRYYSLTEERSAERTVYGLASDRWGPDLWSWVNRHPEWFPLVDARYGSATFVPMADNALFEVRLSATGLLARPLNDPARKALNVWE